MEHATNDFAILRDKSMAAAKNSVSAEQRQLHLAIAHHYGQIALLKGRRTSVLETNAVGEKA
jgi:hypothetical protein